MKNYSSFLSLLTAFMGCFFLSSCHIVPDQGPTGMNKIQNDQFKGKRSKDNYVIININQSNLRRFNKPFNNYSGVVPRTQKSKLYSDNIRPHDKLALLVIDTAEQGAFANSNGPVTFGPLEVPLSGKITIPYAGEFSVLGKTIHTVEKEIKTKYATIFNTAEVSLSRVNRQPLAASVLGLARRPGQYPIRRKETTVAELIAQSGGATEKPFLCDYLVHRNKKTYRLNHNQITKQKILVQDEDLIEIKRRKEHSIILMGSVRRPGTHKFPKSHCHLSDLLGSASGMNINSADATGIFVFRKVSGRKTHLYRFNLQKPEGVIYASKFNIHADDIIYITEAPLSRWGRVIRGILPFSQLQSFGNVANIGN